MLYTYIYLDYLVVPVHLYPSPSPKKDLEKSWVYLYAHLIIFCTHRGEKVLSIPSTALTLWQLLAMEEMSPGQRGPGHGTLGTAPSQGGLTQFLVSYFKHKSGHNLYRPLPHKCNHQSKNLLEPVLSLAGKGQERQLHPKYRSSITPWFIYATPSLTAYLGLTPYKNNCACSLALTSSPHTSFTQLHQEI